MAAPVGIQLCQAGGIPLSTLKTRRLNEIKSNYVSPALITVLFYQRLPMMSAFVYIRTMAARGYLWILQRSVLQGCPSLITVKREKAMKLKYVSGELKRMEFLDHCAIQVTKRYSLTTDSASSSFFSKHTVCKQWACPIAQA